MWFDRALQLMMAEIQHRLKSDFWLIYFTCRLLKGIQFVAESSNSLEKL